MSKSLQKNPVVCGKINENNPDVPILVQDYSDKTSGKWSDPLQAEGGGINPLGYLGYTFTGFGYKKVFPRASSRITYQKTPTNTNSTQTKALTQLVPRSDISTHTKCDSRKHSDQENSQSCSRLIFQALPIKQHNPSDCKESNAHSHTDQASAFHGSITARSYDSAKMNGNGQAIPETIRERVSRCSNTIKVDGEPGYAFPTSVSLLLLFSRCILVVLCIASFVIASICTKSATRMPAIFSLSLALIAAVIGFFRSICMRVDLNKLGSENTMQLEHVALKFESVYRFETCAMQVIPSTVFSLSLVFPIVLWKIRGGSESIFKSDWAPTQIILASLVIVFFFYELLASYYAPFWPMFIAIIFFNGLVSSFPLLNRPRQEIFTVVLAVLTANALCSLLVFIIMLFRHRSIVISHVALYNKNDEVIEIENGPF